MENQKRETFSSGLAVFFATLGSAVGLGNIWKFPYLTGTQGGGAFVFLYLICVLLVGIPIMCAEFAIGRSTRSNIIGAFTNLKKSPAWKIIGYMGILSTFLIMFFYSAVAGWVYKYVYMAVTGAFSGLAGMETEAAVALTNELFGTTIGGGNSPILWQFIVLATVSVILIGGIKNGIEKATRTMMPLLLVLIILTDIRALTLPGAGEGLRFLFSVDFSAITGQTLITALGLAFFKLSLGLGCMITYSSYFTQDNNMMATAGKVAISDTVVSLLAGVAIFPVVFQFGMEPTGGPGLLFMTIPLVFSKMIFGNILLIGFFLLTAMAATMAMLSLVEIIVAFLVEEAKMARTLAVVVSTGTIFIVGALTVHSSSIFGSVKILGLGFFDLFDKLSSNILLPLGGLLIAIFVGYVMTWSQVQEELTNGGQKNMALMSVYRVLICVVSPLLMVVVFLSSIGVIKL